MPAYRAAKAHELDSIFDWLGSELGHFRTARPEHRVLVDRLQVEFEKVEHKLGLLQAILADPSLEKRAQDLLRDVTRFAILTSTHYMAGLRRQSAEDSYFRKVLLNAKTRLQLDWIEDVLVCLYRELGILPEYRQLHSIPVFYGPPQLLETVFELAGTYHEFGHSVYARHKLFGQQMATMADAYFKRIKAQPGPLTPEQKSTRDQAINQYAKLWNEYVVPEIFCDIFGSYVCGTAYFSLMVDLGISRGRDPFALTNPSYPPAAARVNVSWNALLPEQRQRATAQGIHGAWQMHTQQHRAAHVYSVGFSDELLIALTDQVISLIQTHLPNVPRYTKPLPELTSAKSVGTGVLLEDLINAGVTVLFEAPHELAAWQAKARSLIA